MAFGRHRKKYTAEAKPTRAPLDARSIQNLLNVLSRATYRKHIISQYLYWLESNEYHVADAIRLRFDVQEHEIQRAIDERNEPRRNEQTNHSIKRQSPANNQPRLVQLFDLVVDHHGELTAVPREAPALMYTDRPTATFQMSPAYPVLQQPAPIPQSNHRSAFTPVATPLSSPARHAQNRTHVQPSPSPTFSFSSSDDSISSPAVISPQPTFRSLVPQPSRRGTTAGIQAALGISGILNEEDKAIHVPEAPPLLSGKSFLSVNLPVDDTFGDQINTPTPHLRMTPPLEIDANDRPLPRMLPVG